MDLCSTSMQRIYNGYRQVGYQFMGIHFRAGEGFAALAMSNEQDETFWPSITINPCYMIQQLQTVTCG